MFNITYDIFFIMTLGTGLSDDVDDVSAVAASSLIPVAAKLTELVLGSVPQVRSLTGQRVITQLNTCFLGHYKIMGFAL